MDINLFLLIDKNYEEFSKTYRTLCDYIRNNYLNLSYLSIVELGKKAGVSVGSITGFCKALGFAGYSAFQKELQSMAHQDVLTMHEMKNSISGKYGTNNFLKEIIDLNITNLQRTYSDALGKEFQTAIDVINSGKHIYIIGLRSTYAVAYYLYFMLSDFKNNVTLLSPGEGDMYDRIMHISSEDVLVAIGFERYAKTTCGITRFFKDHQCKIVALTDYHSSPLAILADVLLIAKNSSTTFSFVSAMTILNALIIGIGRVDQKSTLYELEIRQSFLKNHDVHF